MTRVLEVKDFNFSYPDGRSALKGLSFDISSGETVAVIGPNGAGKTTLLLALNGILRGKGSIKVEDLEVSGSNLKEIRKRVGVVFQDPDDQLFCPTVNEDVMFGLLNLGLSDEDVQRKTIETLKILELEEFGELLSHHLSAGEKKRVALATVLAMEPDIIALDEPTANLDPRSRRHLIETLKNIKHAKIIATHDLEMALELADRVIVLNKGKIAAFGRVKDILENAKLMEENALEVPLSLKYPEKN